MQLWDLGGKESLRKLWESYYDEIEGLVYMIDLTSNFVEDSIAVLNNNILLNKDIMTNNIPILILLNKIDIAGSDSAKLKRIYNSINYNRLDKKRFLVMEISALKG